jgi:hypothetical protein
LAGLAALGVIAVSVVVAAASVALLRYLFPMRIAVESAGVLAVWGLLARAPDPLIGLRLRRALRIAVALLALGWGGWRTARGLEQVREAAGARGEPSTPSMHDLAAWLDRQIPAAEPVMSNLGPVLGWYTRRSVVHLSLTPADIDACRRRFEFRHVLLVFREPQRAWPGWVELMERPFEAAHNPEWNITRAEQFRTRDGFLVVCLDLGPLAPKLALLPGERGRPVRKTIAPELN